ncbi:GNAT family protein [Achromobacter xylosoxidans]|uniref:hypothetical protein n=1 Tax=Alcaligenes xylosoxydans xylosoxydans TaxID=85698 RepID=UPI002931620B|nr:hypothetical protein [Achromobacter xylosoxidans]WOB73984.1 hypothetical protein PZA07_00455 [Achromobacter xylosoxidans]
MNKSGKIEIKANGPNGECYFFDYMWSITEDRCTVEIRYQRGTAGLPRDTEVLKWAANYDGSVDIGEGDRRVHEVFRGIGLGSLAMWVLVTWAKKRAGEVSVATILLSAEHAATASARDRRNRFWEKLGFTFDYHDDKSWGQSRPMTTASLVVPQFTLACGWQLEEIEPPTGESHSIAVG